MADVHQWTGEKAARLQDAFEMTQEEFAGKLGVSVRSVASWRANPSMVPQPETQRILDTTLGLAGDAVRRRFIHLARAAAPQPAAQALRVAIAVVRRGGNVLLVCRQDGDDITWQFPAGIVKPGGNAPKVAVRETLDETGVHCMVREHLGERLHPVTRAFCDYFICDYVHGEAVNGDASENVAVAWAPIAGLSRFIPTDRIYPPILTALEATV
ncbi:NUDIX domain-containing protein [Streptomyces olivaceus]|uniref:NUDIX domain-containing protein n=1 Tax=Streptomyces olivaceus TaxID=47716 RepID=UPI0004C6907F|nr:NUDIX domain-containing protein [Streptomyces olivaceus]MBZ6102743.1 NUDIX domain-containing protein [Streptomyces olivaceus]